METRKYVKHVRRNVESILKNYPATRNSDKVLILKYLEVFYGMDKFTPIGDILNVNVNFETIRRSRQLLQHVGKYPADPNVCDRRKRQDNDLTSFYGQNGAEEPNGI